ncbi:diguanylate cyclase (GGDEF)-like protein/PAS domain S-box-containing protein [Pseudomonas sp. TE3786]
MKNLPPRLLSQSFEAATDAILISDVNGVILWCNPATSMLCGYTRRELVGKLALPELSTRKSQALHLAKLQALVAGTPWHGDFSGRCKDGSQYRVHQAVSPVFDALGAVTHVITILHSATAIDKEHAKMRRLAYHDTLTGLPNRLLFTELVHQAIVHAADQHSLLAMMFIDMDQFKNINDTLGHTFGDKLLVAVAERLSRAVRSSDVVARLSGDEFAILISNLDRISVASSLAKQLVNTIDQPFHIEEHRISAHISVGISFYPRDGRSFEGLINRADAAMYCAKAAGGGEYRACEA